jgi:hypothetical protein
MSADADDRAMVEARGLRDAARTIVRDDIATLQLGLAAKPIGQRVRDRAVNKAADLVEVTIDYAMDSKAIIAVTLTAVGVWFARRPLLALTRRGIDQLAALYASRHHDTGPD